MDRASFRTRPWLPFLILIVLGVIIIIVGYYCFYQPVTTVFVLRHAERANDSLSVAGHARAETLVHVVGEAGILAIFTTQFVRTQQTAEPLATHLGLSTIPYVASDTGGVADEVLTDHAGEVALIVGHSDTVPAIVEELGGDPISPIGVNEYDNLFVVTVHRFRKAEVIHLNYGEPD